MQWVCSQRWPGFPAGHIVVVKFTVKALRLHQASTSTDFHPGGNTEDTVRWGKENRNYKEQGLGAAQTL